MDVLLYCFNLYFAATLGISGLTKIADTKYFATTLRFQKVVPAQLIPLVSKTFQWLEIILALLLVLDINILTVIVNLIILFLFAGFLGVKIKLTTIIGSECGCYGKALRSKVDVPSIIVSIILVILATLQFCISLYTAQLNIEFRLSGFAIYCCIGAWLLSRILKTHYILKSNKI